MFYNDDDGDDDDDDDDDWKLKFQVLLFGRPFVKHCKTLW